MALLQIAEPGMSTAPHQHRLAVGIDLGTTNSLVASVRNGVALVLNDEDGRALLPSVVRYQAGEVPVVGHAAHLAQTRDPHNTISSVKRFMGRALSDIHDASSFAYRFVDAPGMVQLRTAAGVKSPVEVSADILRVLRERAEHALGGELVGAVITVPAYFDDAQRQATKDAAQLAGLEVLRLLNEPTAAAIAYGLDNASEGVYAVYDLGGGTFDISILRLSRGVFEVLATNGDSALGGDDFDQRLFCWMLEQARFPDLSAEDTRLLLSKARAAKEALSEHTEVDITAVVSSGLTIDLTLTAAQFNEMTAALVNKTLVPVRKALRDAGLGVEDVRGVVMVGGSTRMPCIQSAVAALFGQTPLTNLDPDKVVALGAAIQANVLAGNRAEHEDWLLLDVTPLSLGIETMGGLAEKIIPRNTTLPAARAQEFTTYRDGQTAMSIHVVQGERELVSDCRSLARFELRGIPPMVAGAAPIRVTLQVDADGLLSVSAQELKSGVQASVTVRPTYGLAEDEISRMLQSAYSHAREDMEARTLQEARVEAQRLCEATQAALDEDGADLLRGEEYAGILAGVHQLEELLASSDSAAIKAAADQLNQTTHEFAGRRMDARVRQALAGQRLDSIG